MSKAIVRAVDGDAQAAASVSTPVLTAVLMAVIAVAYFAWSGLMIGLLFLTGQGW